MAENVGALRTICVLIFVSFVTNGGIGRSGLTSVSKTSVILPSRTMTEANSVTRCDGGWPPSSAR